MHALNKTYSMQYKFRFVETPRIFIIAKLSILKLISTDEIRACGSKALQ